MRPASRYSASFLPFAAGLALLIAAGVGRAQSGIPEAGYGERRPERALVFFPPFPPPLDAPAPGAAPVVIHPLAPGELAEYVGEYFYPQLSACLHTGTLTAGQHQQLASYRATKQALQQEIQLELSRTRDVEPAARHTALQALARRQASALAALDVTAEELRTGLIVSHLHWNAYRDWSLTMSERRAFSPSEIVQVMFGCAFYDKGLLPAQRGLLLEIAHELLNAAPSTAAAAAAQVHVMFSPATSRVLWPDGLSSAELAKLAAYQAKKAALKKELYDAVLRSDSRSLRFLRNPWPALAAKQGPRLAELEKIAEDIRLGLPATAAALPVLPRSPVPPRLAEQAGALNQRRALIKRETTLLMEGIANRVQLQQLPLRIRFWFETDGMKFLVIPGRGDLPSLGDIVRAVGAEISAIADDYGRDLTALANAEEALRDEIAATIGSRQAQAVENAFSAAVRAVDATRHAAAYAEYRAAVFQPGLSAEQRRVLFDGAIEKLDLSLPRGHLQPWMRSESW